MALFFHYLKVIYRTTVRQYGYSLISIIGFAVGLAAATVVLLHVKNEMSYEKDFKDHERVYRIWTKFMAMGEFAPGPDVILETLPEKYPLLESWCRVKRAESSSIKVGEFSSDERGIWVEHNFFEMFDYPFLEGNSKALVEGQNSMVLSSRLADKLFNGSVAIGETVLLGKEEDPYLVSGVVETEGIKSHLNAEFWLVSDDNTGTMETTGVDSNWLSISSFSYVKLQKNASPEDLQLALDNIIRELVAPSLGAQDSSVIEEWMASDGAFRIYAQPIDDIHLKSDLQFDLAPGGDHATTQTLLVIGLIIMVMTTVNYINLATARAAKRAREVGIKKVVGSSRSGLVGQFLTESLFLCLFSALLALGFAEIFLLLFQKLTGNILLPSIFELPSNLLYLFALAGATGLVAGIYPALFIASFRPGHVLKGSFMASPGRQGFRNALVVVQFVFSISLIIGSFTIFDQLQYMKKKDLGFVRENVLVINNAHILKGSFNHFKEAIAARAEVQEISAVRSLPGSSTSFSSSTMYLDTADTPLSVRRFTGDYNYPTTIGYELLAGRTFSRNIPGDTSSIILNESAAKELGLDDPIGKIMNRNSESFGNLEIIGIVRDFNFGSFREPITPAMISMENVQAGKLIMRISTANPQPLIEHITGAWNDYTPEAPLNYSFLDDNFAQLMADDKMMSQVVSLFTALAVFISCLGLLGLSSYLVSVRRKEISVRKVLGADVGNIITLLNKKYLWLMVVSLAISIPLSLWTAGEWLSGFAYNTGLSVGVFVSSPLLMMLIVALVVGYQSVRTALDAPVKYLGEE